ncbi:MULTISPECIES: hypothetical protein [Stenotrophomonas]|jgi:hypothetical protein|uniref:Uncharacterized protein n=1 Tax=Stenotrophomonas maltophilia TaxID=40324 RepID=A0AAI9CLH3_STEMA|nr:MULTISPECIES: hypothetical protein [Stenotrophomonas]EKT2105278.1 hypothetical protein [Stenotrophomonas maltophilia]EKZ1927440.1 hypothetical protein [Stenotrophomonas maltophilia]EMB2747085.1 hypothetical protein [Stenotrophomonas maltophilia]MBH1418634.1 hypothetical protein [Stenotrophomonas maltophilia]MBH1684715.1 hypothetical protein [Stenotrophomonas maltophilia]
MRSDLTISLKTALDLVADERHRQVNEKGYSAEHDDEHAQEELAAAAAFYLLPSWMNQDVVSVDANGAMEIAPLQQLVAGSAFNPSAWEGLSRLEDDPEDDVETRIQNVVRGLALGTAELERLLRLRDEQGGC